jgi:D-psicose/D-tagatose/L-ribulose 3-epimerase
MKFGVCTGLENVKFLQEAGFDYVEPTVLSVERLSNKEFDEVKTIVDHSPIKAEVCNCFIPGDMKLTGPNVDYKRIQDYLAKVAERLSQLGTELIVFGSGGARNIPIGFDKEKGMEQIEYFLRLTSDILRPYGITVVIEPLRLQECNIINLISDNPDCPLNLSQLS